MKIIRGTIRGGKVQLDAEGFAGVGCVEATRAYLEKLSRGGDAEVTFKEAYYQTEVQQNSD